ncbi:hypothetical protein [Leucobacter ruminantium]|uniref:Uncharacterized protein n=1 Tax=Leucobacter ruminantium TaxID=1289170 RepID=A0A939RZJ7_9MICO|nr:hypothetical protein [Leucobacter ruminantium]MBO1805911.1 hypothetical protein [Leucobacter ruminantium]
MTLKLHAHVQRIRVAGNLAPGWSAGVTAYDDEDTSAGIGAAGIAPSHAEAVQLARVLWADLDAELMAEVHASRSSRHKAKAAKLAAEERATGRCGGCRDLGPHRYTPDCEFRDQVSPEEAYGLLDHEPDTITDIYTLGEPA